MLAFWCLSRITILPCQKQGKYHFSGGGVRIAQDFRYRNPPVASRHLPFLRKGEDRGHQTCFFRQTIQPTRPASHTGER